MILTYQGKRGSKTRHLNLGGEEEAAIYDLIFNGAPLRSVASKTNLSYQGVYIRALAYMRHWVEEGHLLIDVSYKDYLHQAYGHDESNTEGAQNEAT